MEEKEKKQEESPKIKQKIRFDWLDQFRGIVIILFIVQTLAWTLNGNPSDLAAGQYPVIAPWLNHGWKFASYDGIPEMITLIDLGQQIFIFLVGFMQGFAILKRKQRAEENLVWKHLAWRFFGIVGLNVLHMIVSGDINAYSMIFGGTLAQIAWAGLAAGLAALYIENADKRLLLGLGIMVVHSILFEIPILNDWSAGSFRMPYNNINHVAIAIVASAFTLYYFNRDATINEEGIKNRVLPGMFLMFIGAYLVHFVQWAEHTDATTSLSLLAIGTSLLATYVFYKMEQDGFSIPGLSSFGKNLLAIFILEMIIIELIYIPIIVNFIRISFLLDMILVGILPIVLIWIIAYILDWKNIIIKI